jgi:hypothetical protein
MANENAARDRALQDIAKELHQTNRLLSQLVSFKQRDQILNQPAPVVPPEGSTTGEAGPSPEPDKPWVHPYLRRSTTDGQQPQSEEQHQGPYGVGPRPYE